MQVHYIVMYDKHKINKNGNAYLLDPETRISFLFARCRPTQVRCGAARAGNVVWPAAAAALQLLLPLILR